MLSKGAVRDVQPCKGQFLSPFFVVPKKDGGNRPVINLERLNQNTEYQHFKMEGIQSLLSLIQRADYMVKLDLKEAYFFPSNLQRLPKYLHVIWRGKTYQFLALPYGLAVGPMYFVKVLKPVVAFLRRLGVRMVIHLDDLILLNQCKHMLLRDLISLVWLLEKQGFLIYWKMTAVIPVQEIQFLGFLINSVKMVVVLPSKRSLVLQTSARNW